VHQIQQQVSFFIDHIHLKLFAMEAFKTRLEKATSSADGNSVPNAVVIAADSNGK
jgi:hypothetical protein